MMNGPDSRSQLLDLVRDGSHVELAAEPVRLFSALLHLTSTFRRNIRSESQKMKLLLLPLTAGFAAVARAQFVVGSDGETSPSFLCNKTFADANATGIFSFNPGVNQGPQDDQPDNDSHFAINAQWGVTVYDNIGASNATAELSAWYNTNGANYSDDASLWYDVCVLTADQPTYSIPAPLETDYDCGLTRSRHPISCTK